MNDQRFQYLVLRALWVLIKLKLMGHSMDSVSAAEQWRQEAYLHVQGIGVKPNYGDFN